MNAKILVNHKEYTAELNKPIDISMTLKSGEGPTAWYVEPLEISAVVTKHFTGDVNLGGSVNFRNIKFNPHGHGTHTECVGHISTEFISINKVLKQFFFPSQLVSIIPQKINGDQSINAAQLASILLPGIEAIIIRTLPNDSTKLNKNYSNTNPVFLNVDVADLLHTKKIHHLLIDTPSVDKENDDGVLAMHHAFWNYPNQNDSSKTITEMIYVEQHILDGLYLLNLQIAPFENDATPSKPILYKLE